MLFLYNQNHKHEERVMNTVKAMFRVIDFQKRAFLAKNWNRLAQGKIKKKLSATQINHLMLIRFILPCNLNRVIEVTGLSSAGASLFVDKLYHAGILCRELDNNDRRNIKIMPTKEAKALLDQIDNGLDKLIGNYLATCTDEETDIISKASEIICRKLSQK